MCNRRKPPKMKTKVYHRAYKNVNRNLKLNIYPY